MDLALHEFVESDNWQIAKTLRLEARRAEYESVSDLPLAPSTRQFLMRRYPAGIYRHQKEALARCIAGHHVCLSTGTASGKSLTFQAAAIERLSRNPQARVIAIYPMKALGSEQVERWEDALQQAGLAVKVGRIDGNIPQHQRLLILKSNQVVVFTPDIIHAWLFSNLGQRDVQRFLRQVDLVVADEVHTYTGVFGSNAAFLFRRLQHVLHHFAAQPRYIAASATIAKPVEHLSKLFGLTFSVVDSTWDSSPRHGVAIHLVRPPFRADFLTEIVALLVWLTTQKTSRFIAFADSRKQVELIASILSRTRDADDETQPKDQAVLLERLQVLPYRAGYEEGDRNLIQQRLSRGNLRGVISTSALELGIDIKDLDVCVLIGVPRSSTSLWQRIGRIGRHVPGTVIVVNSGDVYDEAVFADPDSFLQRPPAESALYLENTYIQYIHALCLARLGGEHDTVAGHSNQAGFSSSAEWPDHFLALCHSERTGQIPFEVQSMKAEAGDNPNYTFPLRDVGTQFRVEMPRRDGPNGGQDRLGSLNFGQLLREAYPGAVYYYAAQPYRVTRVNINTKVVQVRRERRYTTKPKFMPTQVFPNLRPGNIHIACQAGRITALECNLMVRQSLTGLKERRGSTEFDSPYPLDHRATGCFYDQPFFTRNFFTTGVVLSHPALSENGVELAALSALVYEAFLMLYPFERQDIDVAVDRYRQALGSHIAQDSPFIAIYDQTYGSLRLSGRLMESGVLAQVMHATRSLPDAQRLNAVTVAALDAMLNNAQQPAQHLSDGWVPNGQAASPTISASPTQRVIWPGSKGVLIRTGEEFHVLRVFLARDGLRYEGRLHSIETQRTGEWMTVRVGAATSLAQAVQNVTTPPTRSPKPTVFALVHEVAEIPGESELGLFDDTNGQVVALSMPEISAPAAESPRPTSRGVNTSKLAWVLVHHFSEDALRTLCSTYELAYDALAGSSKPDKVGSLIAYCETREAVWALLQDAFALYKRLHLAQQETQTS